MFTDIFNNNLLNELMNNDFAKEMEKTLYKNGHYLMRTDIKENSKEYIVYINLPGFKKEEINAEFKDGYLTITTNKNADVTEDTTYILKERYAENCSRSYYIGEHIDEENIYAEYENGILTVTIPKKEQQMEQKKVINIK